MVVKRACRAEQVRARAKNMKPVNFPDGPPSGSSQLTIVSGRSGSGFQPPHLKKKKINNNNITNITQIIAFEPTKIDCFL